MFASVCFLCSTSAMSLLYECVNTVIAAWCLHGQGGWQRNIHWGVCLPGLMQTLEAMLRPKVTTLPGHIQAVYVQNAVKLFATVLARQEGAGDRQAAQETTELLIEKLPQFVQSSDLEVQERPHRPLVDSDKLPVRTHRPTEGLKSPDSVAGVEEQGEKKSSKKIKKDKEKDKERKKSKEEKKKKKHRKSASGKEVEEEGQVEKPAPPAAESESTAPPAAPPTEDSDLDFWLSSAPVPSQSQPELVDPAPSSEPEEPKDEEEREESKSSKHKKKKHRKEKEEKSKKKKKKNQDEGAAESVQNGTLEEEEEPLPPMSNYSLLAENSDIKMLIKEQGPEPGKVCDIQGNLQDGSQVVVSVIFENKGSSFLKSMEFNVMDSLNTKLVRPEGASVHDGIAVPFQLPPGVSNEARFVFTVQSIIMPQKLKGTLTFIVKTEDGSSHEKLDFKLLFTCTSYLITTPCYSDAFAKLLESGELKMISLKLEGITMPFHHLLAKICFHHHFSVVERIDSCSSMYSRSIQGHHVCLLVKTGDKSVSIDAKCDEPTLLSNVLDEIKLTFAVTC
ncbi:AP-3 complex subunit delta-1 [Acipenser oxyrinchus oxyrinchus]|uniref:AP-3 complex subunit delta-1 n=1 Tax=Acipenser oxyrinchus oxyrinchus TaxID=40147 RepID=A0AAD8CLV9_ACIOX|nr:AP-3 complex subunit delta-1 [Acipenser oxyrinchus oxyrinchus]